jgi:VCBS repeat-containing protein
VLLNDTDVDNDPLTAVLDSAPSHGTLILGTDGSFTYTPAASFSGVDTFTYHASDGLADSNIATVQITITGYRIYLPLVLVNP